MTTAREIKDMVEERIENPSILCVINFHCYSAGRETECRHKYHNGSTKDWGSDS